MACVILQPVPAFVIRGGEATTVNYAVERLSKDQRGGGGGYLLAFLMNTHLYVLDSTQPKGGLQTLLETTRWIQNVLG